MFKHKIMTMILALYLATILLVTGFLVLAAAQSPTVRVPFPTNDTHVMLKLVPGLILINPGKSVTPLPSGCFLLVPKPTPVPETPIPMKETS